MTDNVIILGAGFSCDAGIPMLSNFIERMWEYSVRGSARGNILSIEDKRILAEALEIRKEMDGYHGRVAFDDRNIEDILSMLVFNLMGGGTSDRNKLKAFTNAISKTIELACNVKHPGIPINTRSGYTAVAEGSEIYRRFWRALFKWYGSSKSLPTIITFNYDLVLERSLLQVLINKFYSRYDGRVPFNHLSFDYQYKNFPLQNFDVEYVNYGYDSRDGGTIIKPSNMEATKDSAKIEILKLHGSLNFPNNKSKLESEDQLSLTNVIENPYILPPVSNKQSNGIGNQSWKVALQRLQEAKNVIFVGYSLPKTDMYMQFFLKAALGPNQELNKIYVFDPVLWQNSHSSSDMKDRYEKCFSEQLRSRIVFNPSLQNSSHSEFAGTAEHFVNVIENKPTEILF